MRADVLMLILFLALLHVFQLELFFSNENVTEQETLAIDSEIINGQLSTSHEDKSTSSSTEYPSLTKENLIVEEIKEKELKVETVEVPNDTIKILSFKEWKGIRNNENFDDEDDGVISVIGGLESNSIPPSIDHPSQTQASQNFASKDCGARIIASNPESSHSSMILNDNLDSYSLNPCSVFDGMGVEVPCKIFFIIQLCEQIEIHFLGLGNMESYSSNPKIVRLSYSFSPTRHDSDQEWRDAGTYTLQDERKFQVFKLEEVTQYTRIIKIEVLESYKSEPYCPLTLVHIYGASFVDKISFKPHSGSPYKATHDTQSTEFYNSEHAKIENETSSSGNTYLGTIIDYIKSESKKNKFFSSFFSKDITPEETINSTLDKQDVIMKENDTQAAYSLDNNTTISPSMSSSPLSNDHLDMSNNVTLFKSDPRRLKKQKKNFEYYDTQDYFCSNSSLLCSWDYVLYKSELTIAEKYCLAYLIHLSINKSDIKNNSNITNNECLNSTLNHTLNKESANISSPCEPNGILHHRRPEASINTFDAMNLKIKELKKNLTLTTHYLEEVSVNFREAIDDIRKQTMNKINILEKNHQILLNHMESLLHHISLKNESYLLLQNVLNNFEVIFTVLTYPPLIYFLILNSICGNLYLIYLFYLTLRKQFAHKPKFDISNSSSLNSTSFNSVERPSSCNSESCASKNVHRNINSLNCESINHDCDHLNDSSIKNLESSDLFRRKMNKRKLKNKKLSPMFSPKSSNNEALNYSWEDKQNILCSKLSKCTL